MKPLAHHVSTGRNNTMEMAITMAAVIANRLAGKENGRKLNPKIKTYENA